MPVLASTDGLSRRAPGVAPGKQATTEKGAFQRTVAVHAAAAKAGGFAGGVQSGHDLPIAAEYARVQVGLKAAQRLAGENVEFHCDQRAMRRVEDPVRLGGADQPVANIAPCVVN